jgi:hypothetical protein
LARSAFGSVGAFPFDLLILSRSAASIHPEIIASRHGTSRWCTYDLTSV